MPVQSKMGKSERKLAAVAGCAGAAALALTGHSSFALPGGQQITRDRAPTSLAVLSAPAEPLTTSGTGASTIPVAAAATAMGLFAAAASKQSRRGVAGKAQEIKRAQLVRAAFSGERAEQSSTLEALINVEATFEDEVITAAAYMGEKGLPDGMARKTRCLHPDKSGPFLCSDCPRRGRSPSVELETPVVAAMAGARGEETAEEGCLARKTRCLHPDKSGPFLCSDCPRRGRSPSVELETPVVAAMAGARGEETAEEGCLARKTRCLHPDKSGPFLCSDCPRR